ncbi:MAG: sulfotransferase domain-containing protein [Caldilinea sp.]
MNESIIVVSGLPRSGTSLMMKMLAAGGISLLTDGTRAADLDNPEGYYEFELVKSLDKSADSSWLASARGRAVKIISALLTYLPSQYQYQVIFMQRNLQEILASQQKMLRHQNVQNEILPTSAQMEVVYTRHLRNINKWLEEQSNFEIMYVDYNHLVANKADEPFEAISRFLRRPLNIRAMRAAIIPTLYRNRAYG